MSAEVSSEPTAAILLIGQELLTGKIVDQNAVWLTPRLRAFGVRLLRVVTVPDEIPAIAQELRRLSALADHVFTSGGIGPTHDDVTLQAVAAAFDVPMRRHAQLEEGLRAHFKERLCPDHLRMADLPEGTELLHAGQSRWPVFKLNNVYVFPGIPELFRDKFEGIEARFVSGRYYLRSLYLNLDEAQIAPQLAALEPEFGVQVGSYPKINNADHRVHITIEARSAAPVNAATEALLAALHPEQIVRVEAAL